MLFALTFVLQVDRTFAQTQVQLKSAQLQLDRAFVSEKTDATLEIFRTNSGPAWQTGQCFELYVSSPYLDSEIYKTFTDSQPPTCEAVSSDFKVVCNKKQGVYDTLQLSLTFLTTVASNQQSIRIDISSFYTPFSSQRIKTINVRSFSDAGCTTGMKTISVPGLTIQQGTIPASNVVLSSSSNILGDTSAQNTLSVTFKPMTTMDPSGRGKIQIGVPFWYKVGDTGERMYSQSARNKCVSSCMTITYSQLRDQAIDIDYEGMRQECLLGAPITIQCKQFFNPITPTLWPGFSVTIFDGAIDSRIISVTVDEIALNATTYAAAILPVDSFIVDPSNTMISTYSMWTFTLNVNIPLEQGCWIRFYLPPDFVYVRDKMYASGIFIKPSLDTRLYDEDMHIIFRTQDGSIPKSSVLLEGCNYDPALGKTPFGRLDVESISTQNAVKDSQTFEIEIYKDREMTQLIAILADGNILSADRIEPGQMTDVTITPADYRVQVTTQMTITFTITHTLTANARLIIRLPSGLTTPTAGSTLRVVSPDASTPVTSGIVMPGNVIQFDRFVTLKTQAGTAFTLIIDNIKNQNSVRDAGDFLITTYNEIDGQFYVVDSQLVEKSFVAKTGRVDPVGLLVVQNPKNYARANLYTFNFILEDDLPEAGYIQVILPKSMILSPSTAQSSGSCKVYPCTYADERNLKFLMQNGLQKGKKITLVVGGIINPRSFQPSGPIIITTLDSDSESQIDSGYSQEAVMSIPGTIQSFNAIQSSFVNGQVNKFTLSVQATIPVFVGDKFSFTLPPELEAPATAADMNCQGITNVVNVTCQVIGKTIITTFNSFQGVTNSQQQSNSVFSWSISGIRNPPSTRTSQSFKNIIFTDSDGYTISTLDEATVSPVTNKYPAQLVHYKIEQDSWVSSEVTQYRIKFTPINSLPTTGSIQLTYPSQITLTKGAGTRCTIILDHKTLDNNCVIDIQARSITIKEIFSGITSYSGNITITLDDVRNAPNNRPGNGFVIQTYEDESQTYIVDKLNDFILYPLTECEYPCKTCKSGDRFSCTECWSNFDDPQYLMFYDNGGSARCKSFCDPGFTTNGNKQKRCQQCDSSCSTCSDNGNAGDSARCIDCSATHTFRLSMSQTCLEKCQTGMYQSSDSSCNLCKAPCETCKGSESQCTSCNRGGAIPYLFTNQCISECPPGFVDTDYKCLKCQSPCATCSGTPNSCSSCDRTEGRRFVFEDQCFAECPPGSGPNQDTLECYSCEPGCDLCDKDDPSICIKCSKPRLAYNGICIDECPENYAPNQDATACRPWQLSDLGIWYFPFLITGAILTSICLVGMCKRRAKIRQNKMTWMSPQNTLTCVIVCLAPLQFFATIIQWIMAYLYGTTVFCILALLVTVAAITIHVVFQIMFVRGFATKKIPYEIERKVRLDKMDKEEAKAYLTARDERFSLYKRHYKCATYFIFALTACVSFKFNKLFYSFFYDLKVFQAPFSQEKYYRKMHTWYAIIHLVCVDLALICIDITALTQIEQGNQLFITIIETLVLSILNIILASWELWRIKSLLSYTRSQKDRSKLRLTKGIDSDSDDTRDLDKKFDKTKMAERRKVIAGLVRQVKKNQLLFLNNKLDELLNVFGDRKCKSMVDETTGWQLVDDPQERYTWPVSPAIGEELSSMGVKFRLADAYNENNVYADKDTRVIGEHEGTQQDRIDLQDALNRKQGSSGFTLLHAEFEERRQRRANIKKRGRKNQFHAQIDTEDLQDLEFFEASDAGLQSIREHEQEEEEAIRRDVQQSAVAQQQARSQRWEQQQQKSIAQQEADLLAAEKRKREEANSMQQIAAQVAADQAKRDLQEKKRLQEQARQQQRKAEVDATAKAAEDLAAKKLTAKKRRDEDKSTVLRAAQIDVPPNAANRTFNEFDILGDLDRDERGNAMVTYDRKTKSYRDKRNRTVNQRGFLIDKNSNIIDVYQGRTMFQAFQVDSRGEIPEPFNFERYNFNPHDLMGDFDYKNGQPELIQTNSGALTDKGGHQINKQGWLTTNEGHIVDFSGRKRFDRSQMSPDCGIPKLFNYLGNRYDIRDVMGIFEKNPQGKIIPQQADDLSLVDALGRRCNERGYLIDENGNIVDINGRQIWKQSELSNGEFPKIPPYAKFGIKTIMGDITNAQDLGTQQAPLLDRQGRQINSCGYLIDRDGNIINLKGQLVLQKNVLDPNGDLPLVFRGGQLRQDTGSSLSKLMTEIEKAQQTKTFESIDHEKACALRQEGETSLDSQMEDTPANYNLANQRIMPGQLNNSLTIPEEQDDALMQESQMTAGQKQKQKKKKRQINVEVLKPTLQEKMLAGAYGGSAIGTIRRPGVKYTQDRLKDSIKFRVEADNESQIRAQLSNLIRSGSKNDNSLGSHNQLSSQREHDLTAPKMQSLLPDSQQEQSRAEKRANEEDEIFGKEIDQFLADSEWDMHSIDKVSEPSAMEAQRVKQLENDFFKAQSVNPLVNKDRSSSRLQRDTSATPRNKRSPNTSMQRGPDRETILNFTDNPRVIHQGEILPFATKKH